ncbi:MAG: phosphatidylglycerophosphatase A [Puniceicoccales bacterium]|jgi:phosphatidylglycerophosphatase A|nr:phosphatidylglycerophosphatase A [Puniceicoccales bacterium]
MTRILRALPTKFVLNVATLGALGRSRFAPGTLGSLAGIIWYTVGFWHVTFFQFALGFCASAFVGTLFCGEAEYRLQKKDPSCVILDEFLAMPLCYWGIERFASQVVLWKILIYGFLLFRIFDMLKPFGIRSLERFQGGAGIMLDDIAAALMTCIVLHITVPLVFT